MRGRKKLGAVLLVMMLFASGLVVMASVPIGADEAVGGDIDAEYSASWMTSQPETLATADKLIQFNMDQWAGSDAYHLGDQNADIRITLRNNDIADNIIVTDATLVSNEGLFSVDIDTDDGNTIFAGSSTTFVFTIDIGISGLVNHLYEDAFTLELENMEQPSGTPIGDESLDFDIYVASAFQPEFTIDDPEVYELRETSGDPEFEAGELFQEGRISLNEQVGGSISDLQGTLTVPSGLVISGGENVALNPGGGDLFYRIGVPGNNTAPGIYTGTLALQYERSTLPGQTIMETARDIEIVVDFTPRLVATGTTTINQGDDSATYDVTFHNEGNVDLVDVIVEVQPEDWWDVSMHHYENNDVTYMKEVELGQINRDGSSSPVSVKIAAELMAPDGIHRIPFFWTAWYYDNADTGNPTQWWWVQGNMYNHDGFSNTPEIGRLYRDNNGDGVFSGGEVIESDWAAAYTDIMVDDDDLDWTASLGSISASGDVTNIWISVTIYNEELIRYTDVAVELDVGTGTPFFDPADHNNNDWLMMEPTMFDWINANSQQSFNFRVDLNAGWWQQGASANVGISNVGMHLVDIRVDATNEDTEERIEDEVITADVEITGFGPLIYVTAVANHDNVKPGSSFELRITITNEGDDVARNLDATLMAQGVVGWSVVDMLVTSISSYGAEGTTDGDMDGRGNIGDASWGWMDNWDDYQKFNRTNDIKLKELAIEDLTDVVEGYTYITRTLTPPQATILSIHTERLAPGETLELTFLMESDVNMIEGMAYYQTLFVGYYWSQIASGRRTQSQQILLKTSDEGSKYSAQDEFDWTPVIYGIIFAIIAIFCFILGGVLMGRKGEPSPSYEEPYTPYEPEPEPELSEPAPPMDETPPEPPPE
jgi:hypothetical protein